MKKYKKGTASFYIVSFSTLILVIIAASFATVIISAATRSSNDDLSQSAYDAALAGVEDAKLAYSNYRRCVAEKKTDAHLNLNNARVTCEDIMYWMQNPDCDMVAHILGRIGKNQSSEVLVSDTISDTTGKGVTSEINQAYTCVKIEQNLNDYRANLTSSNQAKLVKVEFGDDVVQNIDKIKLSWYTVKAGQKLAFSSFGSKFGPAQSTVTTPPILRLQMIQTAKSFSMNDFIDFQAANNGQTDRATLYLIPQYNGGLNSTITDTAVAKTNNRAIKNEPFLVNCSGETTGECACSVEIKLPQPVGGARNNDTFMFVVSLPYGVPDTDFAMEFLCGESVCGTAAESDDYVKNLAKIKGGQVSIDSTGRANDLYRRVETRMETTDVSFPYAYFAIEMLGGNQNDVKIEKNMVIKSQINGSSIQW